MLRIRRILHPTDLSPFAERSLPVAVRIAQLHGAELELFHAVVLHTGEPFEKAVQELSLDAVAEELDRMAIAKLEELQADSWAGELTVARSTARARAAAPAILQRARDSGADLVVMATHGRRGVRRLLIGSVAEEVLRGAPCPVLAVHADREPTIEAGYRCVLAATDFSETATLAVQHAAALASEYGAELHLVHVIQMAEYPGFYYPDRINVASDVSRLQKEAWDRLEALLPQGPAGHLHVLEGQAPREIQRLSRELDADLIVLGSHGHSGLDRLLLGCTTDHVLRSSEKDVLVFREGGRSLLE